MAVPDHMICPLQQVLDVLGVPESFPEGKPQRAIYCSRTLNLRSIKCIGENSPQCASQFTCLHSAVLIVYVP
jgi:hypothetical protein